MLRGDELNEGWRWAADDTAFLPIGHEWTQHGVWEQLLRVNS